MKALIDRKNDKRALRILMFLRKSNCSIQEASGAGRVLLNAGDHGILSEEYVFLIELAKEGLIEVINNEAVKLASAGERLLMQRNHDALTKTTSAQQQDYSTQTIMTPEGSETVMMNNAESPLASLGRRNTKNGVRFLTLAEFRAGERLRADYTRGHLMPSIGVNWSSIGGGSGKSYGDTNGIAALTDAALASRQRVERAIAAVGPELSGVLVDVCCFLKGLEQIEAERSWPARSAKIVLKSALSALARHYEPEHARISSRGPILHWGSADYRPRMV